VVSCKKCLETVRNKKPSPIGVMISEMGFCSMYCLGSKGMKSIFKKFDKNKEIEEKSMKANNRAFIRRDTEVTNKLKSLVKSNMIILNPDCYFNQEKWLFESGESFHVYSDGVKVTFLDNRLPRFSLCIKLVELEFEEK
jgi:uncharacterized pyridoxamine 5'-phosphate oxidase family protein